MFEARIKKPLISQVISALRVHRRFRGTAVAVATVTMKNASDLMTNAEGQLTLCSDWVDAHADYLFNFAVGQVRDADTAEDLVQDTFLAAVKAQNSLGGKNSPRNDR